MKYHTVINMQHCSGSVQIRDVYNFLRYFWEREKMGPMRLRFLADSLVHCMQDEDQVLPACMLCACLPQTGFLCCRKPLPSCWGLSPPSLSLGRGLVWMTMPAGWRLGNVTSTSCLLPGQEGTAHFDWLHTCCCSDATPLWFRKSYINPEFMLKWLHGLRLILRDEHWIPVSPFLFWIKRHTSGGQPMIYYLIWEMKYKNGKMDIIMS